MELRELHWAWIEQEAGAGNLGPLAAELEKPDCGPIPESVRALLADLARGKRPGKAKRRRIADDQEAQLFYLWQRALGASAGDAIGMVEDEFGVDHSTAYAAITSVLKLKGLPGSERVSGVLKGGAKLAEYAEEAKRAAIPKSQGPISDDS